MKDVQAVFQNRFKTARLYERYGHTKQMIKTRITDGLGIEYPIFQGGMAWIADGKLAAAVFTESEPSSIPA